MPLYFINSRNLDFLLELSFGVGLGLILALSRTFNINLRTLRSLILKVLRIEKITGIRLYRLAKRSISNIGLTII